MRHPDRYWKPVGIPSEVYRNGAREMQKQGTGSVGKSLTRTSEQNIRIMKRHEGKGTVLCTSVRGAKEGYRVRAVATSLYVRFTS